MAHAARLRERALALRTAAEEGPTEDRLAVTVTGVLALLEAEAAPLAA